MTWPGAWTRSVDSRFPLERATTFQIGGPADWSARPETPEEAEGLISAAREAGIPVRCVGMGSNLLVSDEGVAGLVLRMRGLQRLNIDADLVVGGAGITNTQAIQATRAAGLGGLQCLVGYPGTLGGAVRMNAGGVPGYIGERVAWVRGVDGQGRVCHLDASECGFRYRGSDLGHLVVTEVALRLPRVADIEAYSLELDAIKRKKRASQPLQLPSAGCVWKNPPGDAAGRLVDAAGCKGLRSGGAEVSPLHANFVVNLGGATCADVLSLMEEVRRRVLDHSGVRLEKEVIHWNDAAVALSGR
jgi:UDP-N-acetylmuramate dehydrogenase